MKGGLISIEVVIQRAIRLVLTGLREPEIHGCADTHLDALSRNAEVFLKVSDGLTRQEPSAHLNREWLLSHGKTILRSCAAFKELHGTSRTTAVP